MDDFIVDDERVKYLHGYPKDLTVDQKFRLILRLLRKDFPAEYPVRVRREENSSLKQKGYKDPPYGWCWLSNENKPKSERYFSITINKNVSWRQQFETILHEWAHALTWNLLVEGKDHGDLFHRAYGNLYRRYIED